MENLNEGLKREIQNAKTAKDSQANKKIAEVIATDIKEAEQALLTCDVVKMIKCYDSLKTWTV